MSYNYSTLTNQIANHLAHAKSEAAQGRRVSETGMHRNFMRHWAINWKANFQMGLKDEADDCLRRAKNWRDVAILSARNFGGAK